MRYLKISCIDNEDAAVNSMLIIRNKEITKGDPKVKIREMKIIKE